jgi:hypothetical protein
MSRVVKFRGLNSEGEFVHGLPSSDAPNSTAYYNEYSQRICWLPEKGGCANQPIKNGTLCQFTGLHDKNGVEIYEGDILQDLNITNAAYESGAYARGEVVFNECSFMQCYTHDDGKKYYEKITGREIIVGNIHQHPELLK